MDDRSEAFDVVADGTRLDVLRALAERRAERPRDPELSFSDLRDRAGVEDSGRFNYHLDRLRGRFVERTDDGYRLTHHGQTVVSAVESGAYGADSSRLTADLDADCQVCGGPLTAEYEDGMFTVACDADHGFNNTVPPASAEGRDVAGIAEVVSLTTQHEMERALDGICPTCGGSMATELVATDGLGDDAPRDLPSHIVSAVCERCGRTLTNLVGACLVRHPAVVSLYHDHGIDLRGYPPWELPFAMADPVVVSGDPLRVRIDVELDGDAVSLTLDRGADVVAVEERTAADRSGE